jgi:type II secretion system protein H
MRNNRGLTLIELMVVIAIVAVVSAIALPNLIDWRGKRQLEAAVNEMQTAINLAKTIAVKRGTSTFIHLKSPDHGITIYQDKNANGTLETGTDTKFRTILFADSVSLSMLPDIQYISFDSRGFTTAVNIMLTRDKDLRQPKVEVTVTGSSRINWN